MPPLLLDMNMSVEWLTFLQNEGLTVMRWSAIGDPRAPDVDIMAWARANRFVILTQDLDFGTLLALTQAQGPSVIQLRGNTVAPLSAGPLLLSALQTFADELADGALLVLDENRLRVRHLPIK
jgi:predicted nuclease of predicted toxin-antitoxin system